MPENNLPLLIFPSFRTTVPAPGKGFPRGDTAKPSHGPQQRDLFEASDARQGAKPSHEEQVRRLAPQVAEVERQFNQFKLAIQNSTVGIEPEVVLVFELADRIENLQSAVENAGLEFLVELDLDLEGDEEFPGAKSNNMRDVRLFASMANEKSAKKFLNLWKKWEAKKQLSWGETPWRDIFACLKNVRPWGLEETLHETGMAEYFFGYDDAQDVNFQIECFYSKNESKRRENEASIKDLIDGAGGSVLAGFIDKEEIGFHAVRVCMNAGQMKRMMAEAKNSHFTLLSHPSVMYFQQAGQSIVTSGAEEGEQWQRERQQVAALASAVAAVLDGAPQQDHEALSGLVDFDDPFALEGKYQVGERIHGTAMASLIIHGDGSLQEPQINSMLHHVAVMQPDEKSRGDKKIEHFPEDCFPEDRIERAVRRTLRGEAGVPAMAPQVKIINFSLGDPQRVFNDMPSPWARLLDWLSWEYRVLFCVSAGNYEGNIAFDMNLGKYQQLNAGGKISLLLQSKKENRLLQRLIAPAESINSLTIGALHSDGAGDFDIGTRTDILPDQRFPSPISRLGHGFRQSVKPELYMPGGRQLYRHKKITDPPMPPDDDPAEFYLVEGTKKPGLMVARDSVTEGDRGMSAYTAGTSNAAALATRAAIQIHEMLDNLNSGDGEAVRDALKAVMIKALLVHGSRQDTDVAASIDRLADNSRTKKKERARYLGYGGADVRRVLACTEQRCTVIGCAEIKANEVHEYRFPLPEDLSSDELSIQKLLRTMIVTLAWLSPVNLRHRNYRKARLEIQPSEKWKDTPVRMERLDGDHNQVKRGTVQHEVLKGESKIKAFSTGTEIVLRVACKEDATDGLLDAIPYGLAVTLEVAEETSINIYQSIRAQLQVQQRVGAGS